MNTGKELNSNTEQYQQLTNNNNITLSARFKENNSIHSQEAQLLMAFIEDIVTEMQRLEVASTDGRVVYYDGDV